jgi:hypothetical protein
MKKWLISICVIVVCAPAVLRAEKFEDRAHGITCDYPESFRKVGGEGQLLVRFDCPADPASSQREGVRIDFIALPEGSSPTARQAADAVRARAVQVKTWTVGELEAEQIGGQDAFSFLIERDYYGLKFKQRIHLTVWLGHILQLSYTATSEHFERWSADAQKIIESTRLNEPRVY